MATHYRTFGKAGFPDIKRGEPIFGGYRMLLQMNATVQVAIGDSIQMLWEVPGDEYWRCRGFNVSDATAAVSPQGWEKQNLQQLTSVRFVSPTATPADQKPGADWSHVDGGHIVWARGWDGVVYLGWQDAQGNWLHVSSKDPTFNTTLWHPGSRWLLYSQVCEQAGASALAFQIHLMVDRYVMPANVRTPSDESARMTKENTDLANILQAANG